VSQRDAQRIGICFVDADTFWWKADDEPTCPACARSDEGYLANHRFFTAEDRRLGDRIAAAIEQAEEINAVEALRYLRPLTEDA